MPSVAGIVRMGPDPTARAAAGRRRRGAGRAGAHLPAALLAAAAALGGGALPAAADTTLPDIGDASGEVLTRAEEDRLREGFLRQVRAALPVIDDPEIVGYINTLGRRIAAPDPERSYRFLVVDEPEVNAFAGPGGIIAVNAGLVLVTESESELAAVLAHEIAHVTQRHLARMIDRSRLSSLGTLASVAAAIILARQNADAGQAVLAAGLSKAEEGALRFSRENEQEADNTGLTLLAEAGFDPRAMPEFFERFREWQRYTSKPPEYLSTHPDTGSRIADARGRAEQFEPRTYRESPEYPLIRAALRVRLASTAAAAREYFEARLADAGTGAGTGAAGAEEDRYGLALALMAMDRHGEAVELLAELGREFPDRAAHRVASAKALTALGDDARAFELLAESVERFPDHRALTLRYGQALVEAGRADDALRMLRGFQRSHGAGAAGDALGSGEEVDLYRLLALAHERAGHRADSHLALAEFHYRSGDLGEAIRQLEIALEDPAIGEYRSARAETRREELERERSGRGAPRG